MGWSQSRSWSNDANELWEQMLLRPVTTLQETELSEEVSHWLDELDKIHRQISSPFKSQLLLFSKWGGSIATVLGLPAVFAAPPLGVALAIAGIAALIAGHVGARSKKRRDDDLEIRLNMIKARLQEIEAIRAKRSVS